MDRKIPGVDCVFITLTWSLHPWTRIGAMYEPTLRRCRAHRSGCWGKLYPTKTIASQWCNKLTPQQCTSTLDVAIIFVEYDLDIKTMNEVDESDRDRSQWHHQLKWSQWMKWRRAYQPVFVHTYDITPSKMMRFPAAVQSLSKQDRLVGQWKFGSTK